MSTDDEPKIQFENWSAIEMAVQEPELLPGDHEDNAHQELVHFDETDGVIYLNVMDCPTGYGVDTASLNTAEELVDWIYHLRTKPWFSAQHLADFLRGCEEELW